MGLTGAIGTAYVLAVGGDLNGPTLGAILTIVGFSAFGKHPQNIMPIMLGVFIASLAEGLERRMTRRRCWPRCSARRWRRSPAASAGAGASSPASCTRRWRRPSGNLHGGLVLYNNGFAAGLVAAILVPVIMALQRSADDDAAPR